MATLIVLSAVGVSAAGSFAGIIGLMGVAIHREEKIRTLTSEATGTLIQVGRWVNGVYIRAPHHSAADRETTFVLPACRRAGLSGAPAAAGAGRR